MKKRMKWSTALLALVMITAGNSMYAQRFNRGERMGRGQRQMIDRPAQGRAIEALDLTEEQEASLKEMRSAHQKDMQYAASQIREKEAHLQTLLSAPEQDRKAIDNTIDAIASARADQVKTLLDNREDLKEILSEEQIAKLPQLLGPRGKRGGKGFDRGQGFGEGRGFGQGRGDALNGRRGPAHGRGLGPWRQSTNDK